MKSSFLETIKSVDGKVYNLPYHQKRFESVLKHLGVEKYPSLQDYITPPEEGLYRCRVVYTSDTLEISYHPYSKRNIKSLKLVPENDIEYIYKYSNRKDIDKLFSKRGSCDDIIIVKDSLITDTSMANIALYKDEVWFTPKKPLLNGTTRQRLLEEGKIIEKKIYADDIYTYSKIALFNAMIDFDIIHSDNIREIIC